MREQLSVVGLFGTVQVILEMRRAIKRNFMAQSDGTTVLTLMCDFWRAIKKRHYPERLGAKRVAANTHTHTHKLADGHVN